MSQSANPIQDAITMSQKASEQLKETVLKSFETAKPELEKIQTVLQENFIKAQDNLKELQAAATKQPFNPFEVQQVFFTQQLDALKQFNRQIEGNVEKFQQQLSQFSQNLNKK